VTLPGIVEHNGIDVSAFPKGVDRGWSSFAGSKFVTIGISNSGLSNSTTTCGVSRAFDKSGI
jgi:hypothetical protein